MAKLRLRRLRIILWWRRISRTMPFRMSAAGIKAGAIAASSVGGPVAAAATRAAADEVGRALGARSEDDQAVAAAVHSGKRRRPLLVSQLSNPILLRVHPAAELPGAPADLVQVPPFVQRDISEQLNSALGRRHGFVLLVGDSTAGKSRAAFESMRRMLPDYEILDPRERDSLTAIVHLVQHTRRLVLWLDDLGRFLGPGGLDRSSVELMLADPRREIVLLATMRAREYARFRPRQRSAAEPGDDLLRSGRDVLRLAKLIRINRAWSATELERARQYCDDERIAAAVEHASRFGVAEYLAAGPQLMTEWQNAWEPGANPRGAALVQAAVDARRAGYQQPVPQALLKHLHEIYLHQRGGAALRPEPLREALAWATEPLHATSSLLLPAAGKSYVAFEPPRL